MDYLHVVVFGLLFSSACLESACLFTTGLPGPHAEHRPDLGEQHTYVTWIAYILNVASVGVALWVLCSPKERHEECVYRFQGGLLIVISLFSAILYVGDLFTIFQAGYPHDGIRPQNLSQLVTFVDIVLETLSVITMTCNLCCRSPADKAFQYKRFPRA